jgi:2-keto-4-pentenoate hydratase/2-oxohepta-3-ene-1,7-dioic acid hydratase in catechol pathway
MKLIAVKSAHDGPLVARLFDDGRAQVITDVASFWADPYMWAQTARELADAGTPVQATDIVPLVPQSARVICVGLNYRAHADEGAFSIPEHPTLFGRWTASLTAGNAPASVPVGEDGLDWEGEVAAYVGVPLHEVDADTARAAVFGYSTFNDLTARRAQKLTAQWTLGKNADRSGPMGPLVTVDEIGDLREGLQVQTRVNGQVVQDGNTKDMIFEIGAVLSLVSQTMTLHPGDVIATGTPEGVGYVRTPPWLLGAGDIVEVEVERLGILRTPIVHASARH